MDRSRLHTESDTCLCGRSFSHTSALSNHIRSCQKTKKRLSGALDKAREVRSEKKRRRLDHEDSEPNMINQPSSSGLISAPHPVTPMESAVEVMYSFIYSYLKVQWLNNFDMQEVVDELLPDVIDDSHLSIMERRQWTQRNRRLPRRFRDELPQPPQPLPPPHIVQAVTSSQREEGISSTLAERLNRTRLHRFFTTPYNAFGLARRFYTKGLPTYDPEENISLQDLSNIDLPTHTSNSSQVFYPYPNHSSFALGDWFWNGGVQKSQATFRQLIDIICDADFRLEDVREVKWDKINKELGIEEGEWLDEDAGWIRTPVTISVPYQVRRGVPSTPRAGPRNFVVEDFFHKPLVSMVREKISHLKDTHLFHQEPYELLWQPSNAGQEPIRVQGELYNSPAFMDAYRELQDSPGVPGCDLPRVIVALMFWSDATHLTTFGNTKLWPLYLFFGNDSKYLRCRPSCNLCEHVAYFQTVSLYYQ